MASSEITVEIAYALPNEQVILVIKTSDNITIEQAINLSGILKKYPEIDLKVNKIGIFGKLSRLNAMLNNQDRIEIYRPLLADPKVVRKQRAMDGKAASKR